MGLSPHLLNSTQTITFFRECQHFHPKHFSNLCYPSANAAEPLYVALANSTGSPAVVAQDDANAAQARSWTRWLIPLQAFADKGIDLSNVDKLSIGLGTKSGVAGSGGSGTIYIDDIRLYRP